MTSADPFLVHDPEVVADQALSPGPKGRCACGEDRNAAMTRHGRCYACDCRARGMPTLELHHLFGRDFPATVRLPVNEHRVIDAMRLGRSPLLCEPGNGPLVSIAGFLMQVAELGEMAACAAERDKAPGWAGALAAVIADWARHGAEWLLALDGSLTLRLGPEWWNTLGLPHWSVQ